MDVKAIQSALTERSLDAWLFYDHHHRDPIAYKVLGLPESLMVTRRWFYVIPREGEPIKLVHRIEAAIWIRCPVPSASTRPGASCRTTCKGWSRGTATSPCSTR